MTGKRKARNEPKPLVRIVDGLNEARRFAAGIEDAAHGVTAISETDTSGLCTLLQVHQNHLERLEDELKVHLPKA